MSLVSVICSQYPVNLTDPKTRSSLESVLNSRYENLELIAWLPQSQSPPPDWDDTRVRWLVPQDSLSGAAAALNEALRQSQGDFIAWIEPGDIWSPDKLSQQVAALESAATSETAIAYSPVAGSKIPPHSLLHLNSSLHDHLRLHNIWETLSNPLVRSEAITAIAGFDESLPLLGGWDLWLRLTQQTMAIALPTPLVTLKPVNPLSWEEWSEWEAGSQRLLERFLREDDRPDFQYKARHNLQKYQLAQGLQTPISPELRAALQLRLHHLWDEDLSCRHQGQLFLDTYQYLIHPDRTSETNSLGDRWLQQLQLTPHPIISVIIPVFNGEATLGETIDSVLNQTFSDFELLIIDDGSSDHTPEISQSFRDYRLHYQRYENAGPATSRNRGAAIARGHYLSFIDADDRWTPDKLEQQWQALETHPDAAVAYSWTNYIDEAGDLIRTGSHLDVTSDSNGQPQAADVLAYLLLGDFLENGSNVLLRRDAFERVQGFDPSLTVAHDWDLFLRLAARYFFICVPQAQIQYRLSKTSISSQIERQETYCKLALERAYASCPEALKYLENQSFINLYYYLVYKALQAPIEAENCRLALSFIQKLEQRQPRYYTRDIPQLQAYQSLLNRIKLICEIFGNHPTEQATKLCQQVSLSLDISELLTYTKSKPYPAISVIIPAYNAQSTITETLESVFAQTFTDFEIIVIDDGSTDDTVAVVKQLQDDRLKVFCYPNAGQGESRNRGACHATGEFFAFLDSDDLWRVDKLEAQYQAIINWTPPAEAEAVYQTRQPAVSYSWVDWVDISGKFIQRGCDYTTNGYVYPQLLLSDFIAGGSNAMIWRGAFYQLRGFNPEFPPAEDRDMWLRLAERFHFVAVEKPLLRYRQVPTSQSANVTRMERSQLRVLEAAFERAPTCPPFIERPELLTPYRQQTYANSYKYLTFKALDGNIDRQQGHLAIKLFKTVLDNEPELWQERRFVFKLWLRILATAFLPPAWTQKLLQRFPTFPTLHSQLLSYTKMGVAAEESGA